MREGRRERGREEKERKKEREQRLRKHCDGLPVLEYLPHSLSLFKMEDPSKVNIVNEFNLLPAIFDIIHSVQKTGDSQEMAKKVLYQ